MIFKQNLVFAGHFIEYNYFAFRFWYKVGEKYILDHILLNQLFAAISQRKVPEAWES